MLRTPRIDPDNPPSGNLFGWKISLIGLVLIVALGALAAYRHYALDVPVGFEDPLNMPETRGYYQEKAEQERSARDTLIRQKERQ